MSKQKASRNKTIDMTVEEGKDLLARCIRAEKKVTLSQIMDKTVCGDTFVALAHVPPQSVDLLVADPPYNLTKSFDGNVFSKRSTEEYEAYTRRWLSLVRPLLKKDASIYVCCDWESSLIIGRVLGEFFTVRNRITWQREKGRGAKNNWKNGMEDIWFATVSDDYVFNLEAVKVRKRVLAPYRAGGKPKDWENTAEGNFRNTCPSNFWDDITIPFWSMKENTAHPTQKSEKLLAKIILASSDENDVILDPFLGSGTTSVVAKKLGRHYIGIEKNPRYCIFAEKRLQLADTDQTIQGYENGVFWERNVSYKKKKGE